MDEVMSESTGTFESSILPLLVKTSAAVTGEDFFNLLVQHLGETLKVRICLIAHKVYDQPGRVETVALWMDGQHQKNVEYDLLHTPCALAYREDLVFIPEGLLEKFPDHNFPLLKGMTTYLGMPLFNNRKSSIGHLAIIHDGPIKESRTAIALMSVLAARAAGELDRQRIQERLEHAKNELFETARQVGKAEIASQVLHNVGNVVNSINTSVSVLRERYVKSVDQSLEKLAQLLIEQQEQPGFLASDRGRQVPVYLRKLQERNEKDRQFLSEELNRIYSDIEHVKAVISMQQSVATGNREQVLRITDLVEDSLRMNAASIARRDIEVRVELHPVPEFLLDKHNVLQILVNMLSNAHHALEHNQGERILTARAYSTGESVRVEIEDNGIGIPAENLEKIFTFGFTTRKAGHGFGLHSSARLAREMGGSLTAHSDGVGKGALFILELPIRINKIKEPVAKE